MPETPHTEAPYVQGEYEYTEGVESLSWAVGDDREFTGTAPSSPVTGISARRGNPTIQQIQDYSAEGIAVEPTDMLWTIFAETFGSDNFKPKPGDQLYQKPVGNAAASQYWTVKDVKTAVYGTQYICLCTEAPRRDGVR